MVNIFLFFPLGESVLFGFFPVVCDLTVVAEKQEVRSIKRPDRSENFCFDSWLMQRWGLLADVDAQNQFVSRRNMGRDSNFGNVVRDGKSGTLVMMLGGNAPNFLPSLATQLFQV